LVPHIPPPGVLLAEEGEFARLERDREIYQCEIGNLDLHPIGHDERNRPTRGVSGGGEVYGHLRFPRSMGKVKEAWVLCGFEPVLPGQARERGCCDAGGKGDRQKNDYGKGDDGKPRRKYFLDSSDD
jgi:hypothetical protein